MGVQANLAINILKAVFVEHGRECALQILIQIAQLMIESFSIRNPQDSLPAAAQAIY
jgi:hypothetical protein